MAEKYNASQDPYKELGWIIDKQLERKDERIAMLEAELEHLRQQPEPHPAMRLADEGRAGLDTPPPTTDKSLPVRIYAVPVKSLVNETNGSRPPIKLPDFGTGIPAIGHAVLDAARRTNELEAPDSTETTARFDRAALQDGMRSLNRSGAQTPGPYSGRRAAVLAAVLVLGGLMGLGGWLGTRAGNRIDIATNSTIKASEPEPHLTPVVEPAAIAKAAQDAGPVVEPGKSNKSELIAPRMLPIGTLYRPVVHTATVVHRTPKAVRPSENVVVGRPVQEANVPFSEPILSADNAGVTPSRRTFYAHRRHSVKPHSSAHVNRVPARNFEPDAFADHPEPGYDEKADRWMDSLP